MGTNLGGTMFADEFGMASGFGVQVEQANGGVEATGEQSGEPIPAVQGGAAEVRLYDRVINYIKYTKYGYCKCGQQLLVAPEVAAEELVLATY